LASLAAAAPRAQAPSFDVASVRPSRETTGGDIRAQPNGRLTATGATVRALILRAYALHESQLIDAPDWTGTERFDIEARVATPPSGGPDALMPMLRTLLAERFDLRLREDTREMPAYRLVHARQDKRLGPQITPTKADCSTPTAITEEQIRATARDGWPPCGMVFVLSFTTGGPDGVVKVRFRRSGTTMTDFAPTLQGVLGRPVLDRTGLAGRYDLEYSYSPRPSSAPVAVAENLPFLGAALEEQLGLKVESARAPVPVLVVQSVDRPTDN
jgi:uncharacterized protein (TIGR03435 family)